jgi:hypothetical protein
MAINFQSFPTLRLLPVQELVSLIKPAILYSRNTVLSTQSPIPQESGLYAWYFKEVPPAVPTNGCIVKEQHTLLYVGISPKNLNSTQNLRKRIVTHFKGNAEGSTLRLTLGTLLTEQSGFPLRRVGSGKRMTFTHSGEQWLDEWMAENAFVCWTCHPTPWEIEKDILQRISLPLNIQDNTHHPFSSHLSDKRKHAKRLARDSEIATENNQRSQQ